MGRITKTMLFHLDLPPITYGALHLVQSIKSVHYFILQMNNCIKQTLYIIVHRHYNFKLRAMTP